MGEAATKTIRAFLQSITALAISFGLASDEVSAAPYPASEVLTSIDFDWTTHVRLALGSDNWPVTWSDDDHQYTSWGDGGGFGGTSLLGRVSLGVGRIEGDFDAFTGFNVFGGVNHETPATFGGKSYGILSVAGTLHMWVSPGSNVMNYEMATVYSSDDKGVTWQAAAWSFTEAQGLVLPTFLQFGRDYSGARDQFVYVYAIELVDASILKVQMPGRVALLRVPETQIGDENAYEFFAGLDGSGNATWTSSIGSRAPVFEDPSGVGWNLSVSYNEALNRYLLATEHTATFRSNIGIFDAPEPWGPWTTVLYEDGWDDLGVSPIGLDNTAFFWNFANRWSRNGGKEFTLVFTGIGTNGSFNAVDGSFTVPEPSAPALGLAAVACTLFLSHIVRAAKKPYA